MNIVRCRTHIVLFALLALVPATRGRAQTPAPEPPPVWDTQFGLAFVGTSGNTDTTTFGADFAAHRRWPLWKIDAMATGVQTETGDVKTAERYIASLRGQRKLSSLLGLSTGERVEHDPFAGVDFRSIADVGLTWNLANQAHWIFEATTALAWSHEKPTIGDSTNHPTGVLEALSTIPFGATGGKSTQRFTFYPDFEDASAYRSEAEVTAQATMNSHLALKFGYLFRFSNQPLAGFKKTDNTTTASVVLTLRSADTIH